MYYAENDVGLFVEAFTMKTWKEATTWDT